MKSATAESITDSVIKKIDSVLFFADAEGPDVFAGEFNKPASILTATATAVVLVWDIDKLNLS